MKIHRLAMVLGAVIFAAALTGCSTADRYRLNEAPELESMALTHDQRANRMFRVFNIGLRQVADDFDMIWLLDRPSKLSFYPIP